MLPTLTACDCDGVAVDAWLAVGVSDAVALPEPLSELVVVGLVVHVCEGAPTTELLDDPVTDWLSVTRCETDPLPVLLPVGVATCDEVSPCDEVVV